MKKIALTVLLVATAANADIYKESFGLTHWGSIAGNVIDHDFNLGAIDSIDSVVITLSHDDASDIELFLTAPDGRVFTLSDDNGFNVNLGTGDSFLHDTRKYTFVESSNHGNWGDVIPFGFAFSGEYQADEWQSGSFGAGTWNITLNDDSVFDNGAVGYVAVNYTSSVPAPGAAALLGLGGLVATRRRRA